jgi:long-chain acyl-CoA synthetase
VKRAFYLDGRISWKPIKPDNGTRIMLVKGGFCMRWENASDGVYQTLVSSNQKRGLEIALTYFGRRISYRTMFAYAERCACACLRWGVKAGDCVLLCSAAVPELVYALLGLWKIGAIPHMLNPSLSQEQINATVKHSKANLVLVLDQLLPHVQDVLQEQEACQCILIPIAQSMPLLRRRGIVKRLATIAPEMELPRRIFWKEFLESGRCVCCAPMERTQAEQTVLILEETDANGKVCCVSLRQETLCSRMKQLEQCNAAWSRQERYLGMIPPWEREGIARALLVPLSLGLTLVLQPQANADRFAETLLKERPQHVLADQRVWSCAEQQPELVEADLSFLKSAEIVTEAWQEEELSRLNRFLLEHNSPITLQREEETSPLRRII